jgi:GNAT superfamily N-acetyltransferase
MQVLVRPREEVDLTGCTAALKVVHLADGYPSAWPSDIEAWLTPDGFLCAWVAVNDSLIVGHLALGQVDELESPHLMSATRRPSDHLVEIQRLFVVPAARRAGIAKKLLDTATQCARSQQWHPVLEVTAERKAAIRLYEQNGWRRIGSNLATWRRPSGERPIVHQYECSLNSNTDQA